MGEPAVLFPTAEHPRFEVVAGGKCESRAKTNRPLRSSSHALLFWAWSLVILQLLDGIMTAVGVGHYGHQAEANVFLKAGMELMGAVPTLILAKSLAILVVYVLVQCARHVLWVPRALKAVTALYLFAAVIPWTYILVRHYLG